MKTRIRKQDRLWRAANPLVICYILYALMQMSCAATCRKVVDDAEVKINPTALLSLQKIGMTRSKIFDALLFESMPETDGCWGGATGNFDGALLSAGAVQWTLGTGSLQPLLAAFKSHFPAASFQDTVTKLAPKYGKTLFSAGCLHYPITADCKSFVLSYQNGKGRLQPDFSAEVAALFGSDAMVQVQTDAFVTLLGRVQSDLRRLYPGTIPTERDVKWAIDTKVQQGDFPGDADIARVRQELAGLNQAQRAKSLSSLVEWYGGLCDSVDQGGIVYDCSYNRRVWSSVARFGDLGPDGSDRIELANFTFIRSRIANGSSGFWQALTFERRARIALGVGSVGGSPY